MDSITVFGTVGWGSSPYKATNWVMLIGNGEYETHLDLLPKR